MIPRCMIHLALLSCLAAPLAASPWAQVQPADASPTLLAWKPAAGAKFVKRVELAQELGLARLAITMGGVEQLGQHSMSLKSNLQVLLRDELRELDAAGPKILQRRHDDWIFAATLVAKAPGADERRTLFEATSPLSGASVVHVRAADGSYGRHYDERESPEEFLARLEEDCELRGFLPGRAARPGEQWDVAPRALALALCPGGAVPMRFQKGEEDLYLRQLGAGLGGPLHELLLVAAWEGGVRARFVRVEEVEGAREAVVELEVDAKAECDQTRYANDQLSLGDRLEGRAVVAARGSFAFVGKGELRHALDAGHVKSLALEGRQKLGASIRTELGGKDDLSQSIELDGTLKLKWSITAPKARRAAPPPAPK
ncbi:MAG: hypothetical protein RL112_905 [Planctomycetota bacterium]